MTEAGQAAAWLVFFGLVVIVRLLTTRPGRRLVGPWARRLADWSVAQLNPEEEIDPVIEELAIVRRRQRLVAHVERVRRLLATDMAMSRTRQLGNRQAYAWLLDELARTPDLYPAMVSTPSVSLISHDQRRGSTVEVLEIGWRH